MAKAKVKQRKDSKGRVLQKGESQRKLDGMYIYTYVNPYGKRCYVYSKDLFTLREKEQELIKAQMDGLDYYVGGHATINMTFDRYMSTKHNLRETTRSNYLYMFNRFIRADFGNKFLTEVKYTDVKLFYYHLLNEKDIAINTLDTIHTVLHPIFDMAVRDDIIRKNPTDGVLAEIKRNSGKNKGIRHALTIEQQQAFMDTIRTFPEYYHWYPLFATLLGTGMRIGDDDDKIRLNQRKPSKYKGLSRFGPEKNLQRINKFMNERPIFYKNLIQMKENFRFYLRCFYCITKVVILQFNSEKQDRISS